MYTVVFKSNGNIKVKGGFEIYSMAVYCAFYSIYYDDTIKKGTEIYIGCNGKLKFYDVK